MISNNWLRDCLLAALLFVAGLFCNALLESLALYRTELVFECIEHKAGALQLFAAAVGGAPELSPAQDVRFVDPLDPDYGLSKLRDHRGDALQMIDYCQNLIQEVGRP